MIEFLSAQQGVEFAGALESVQIVAAAHVGLADENLGDAASAAALLHLGALLRRGVDVDLLELDAFAGEQLAGAVAIGTPARGVHDDGRAHHAAFATGRFSDRQPAKPPRSWNAFVNPW